jgi:hypothetical protein
MEEEDKSEMEEEMKPEFVVQDWFLEFMVRLANSAGVEWPVTLNVQGSVVTGYLVSAEKYFNNVAETINPPDTDEPKIIKAHGALVAFLKTMAADSAKVFKEEEEPRIGYINLRDAKIYVGSDQAPTSSSVWWRGKISSVDGFTLGTFEQKRL